MKNLTLTTLVLFLLVQTVCLADAKFDEHITIMQAANGNLLDNLQNDLLLGNQIAIYNGFHGNIDEFRLWNKIRSQEDIELNKFINLPDSSVGLIGYWKFDEGNGLFVYNQEDSIKGELSNTLWCQGVEMWSTQISYEFNTVSKVDFEVYPNPFTDNINIQLNADKPSVLDVTIFDISGRRIKNLYNSTHFV